MKTWQIF